MLKIRAHHLLCTTNFVGEGYSDDFSINMKRVIEELNKNPEVTLIAEVDDICTRCPENLGDKCKDSKKVGTYDKKVLETLNLNDNQIIHWFDAKKLACDIIFKNDRRDEICGDCQWDSLCKEVEDKRRRR